MEHTDLPLSRLSVIFGWLVLAVGIALTAIFGLSVYHSTGQMADSALFFLILGIYLDVFGLIGSLAYFLLRAKAGNGTLTKRSCVIVAVLAVMSFNPFALVSSLLARKEAKK